MMDEGYIKYRCDWVEEDAIDPQSIDPQSIAELTAYRDALHRLGFIGEYPGGIGFGNVSRRDVLRRDVLRRDVGVVGGVVGSAHPTGFVITGTQTGNLFTLTAADYALVTDFDAAQNRLACKGLRQASSESLTHGVIYESHPGINAIIHVHSPQLWKQLLNQVPTTRADVPYGTPEMAAETQRLFQESPLLQQKIFVMAGHEDGIVTFGESLQMAYRVLINECLLMNFMTQLDSEAALQLPHQRASQTGGCLA